MSTWTSNELDTIEQAEELTLASVRRDGALRQPVTMCVVRDGDDVYVRSVNGRGSSWFRGVQNRHEARIAAGGVEKDVELIETDGLDERLDAAYRAKHRRYPGPTARIASNEARAATLRLVPGQENRT